MRISNKPTLSNIQLICLIIVTLCLTLTVKEAKSTKDRPKLKNAASANKLPNDPLYITDVDLEHLYDQWEETDDEKLPIDELEPHKRPPPKMNLPKGEEKEFLRDPERMMIAGKKDKTVMAFVTIAGEPTKDETEALTSRWQTGLRNNHVSAERYVIANNRAIFVFHDGSLAYEFKDFFLEQPECESYSIDQKVWPGRAYPWDKKKQNEGAAEAVTVAKAAGDRPKQSSKRRDEL